MISSVGRSCLVLALLLTSMGSWLGTAHAAEPTDAFVVYTRFPGGSEGPGETVYMDVRAMSMDGLPHTLTLSAIDVPDGLKVSFSSPTIETDGAAALMDVHIDPHAVRGRYEITVVGTDAQGRSDDYPFTVFVRNTIWSCRYWLNRLDDGSFESSPSGWSASPGVITDSRAQLPTDGTHVAWLGRRGSASTLSQDVVVPPTCEHYLLFFQLHVDTTEPATAPAADHLVVVAEHTVLGTYSNTDATSGYVQHRIDLDGFSGKTIRLAFISTQNGSRRTNFVVDDVWLRGIEFN